MARKDDAAANGASDVVVTNEEEEEAIRAKLRASGWEKKAGKEKAGTDDRTKPDDKKHREGDRDGDGGSRGVRGRGGERDRREGRSSRRSRSRSRSASYSRSRRRDRDRAKERNRRPRERGRERERERERDRSARRGKDSRRRRPSSRSRSHSRNRTRTRSRPRPRSHSRTPSRSPSGSRSRSRSHPRRHRDRGSKKHRSVSRSMESKRSQSPSKTRSSHGEKPSKGETAEKESTTNVVVKMDEANSKEGEASPTSASMEGKETTDTDATAAPTKPEDGLEASGKTDEKEKEQSGSEQRSRNPRRRSHSGSRSTSRPRRKRRHHSRSRSRSGSHSRRRSSRSRSRSHSRSRHGRSRRHSHSRSHSRHHHRSRSNDKPQVTNPFLPPVPGMPQTQPLGSMPGDALNPTISQLIQQYPTMNLQEIIAKMQASNVTMAAAVSMKPARELYVGNLPPSITGPQLQEFLGTIIQQVGLSLQPGNPITNVWLSTDGHFAFCEMRSIEECNLALMLNQLPLLRQPLKFGRPKSFMGPPQPMPALSARTQTALANLGCAPNPAWFAAPAITDLGASTASLLTATNSVTAPYVASVPEPIALPSPSAQSMPAETSPNQLVMSNIPIVLSEDQVKELVEPFGALKSFSFIKSGAANDGTGNAIFEYENENVTDDALGGLDGLELGGHVLAVRRASASGDETSVVVKMVNMVNADELKDDEDFHDLKEDVEEECKRFGTVLALEIPRPKDGEDVAGVGSIFVRFETTDEAAAAIQALRGRKFGGNIVKATYFPVAKFDKKEFA